MLRINILVELHTHQKRSDKTQILHLPHRRRVSGRRAQRRRLGRRARRRDLQRRGGKRKNLRCHTVYHIVNLDAVARGTETLYLGATIHSPELGVQFF